MGVVNKWGNVFPYTVRNDSSSESLTVHDLTIGIASELILKISTNRLNPSPSRRELFRKRWWRSELNLAYPDIYLLLWSRFSYAGLMMSCQASCFSPGLDFIIVKMPVPMLQSRAKHITVKLGATDDPFFFRFCDLVLDTCTFLCCLLIYLKVITIWCN